jgi:uncharacterized membrane protein YhaH (DUF805 family)
MFLPFRRYFDFQGRSRRLEFWMFFLLNWIVGVIFSIVFVALFAGKFFEIAQRYGPDAIGGYVVEQYGGGGEYAWLAKVDFYRLMNELGPIFSGFAIAYLLYTCIVAIPGIAVTIRRLHDSNRTGWWVLIPALLYTICILLAVVAASSPGFAIGLGAAAGMVGMLAGLSGLVLLVFMFLNGTRGPNQYGPDPKNPYHAGTFT